MGLWSISTQLQLDGEQNSLVGKEGKYPKVISQILEQIRGDNPPTQPKLAITLAVPIYLLVSAADRGAKAQAIADLVIIVFFFLLHVREYTYHKTSEC